MGKITWSSRDQQALEDLQRRRQEFMNTHRGALLKAIEDNTVVPASVCEKLADDLIRCADEFRDLLAPFDSGVRCAPPPNVKLG